MCGIGGIFPLDHNLPKETFPEFAVFSANLIPICTRCNEIKRALWKPGVGRHFLHPYFDDISSHQVLQCKMTVGDDGIASLDFRVDTSGLTPHLAATVASHFKALRLRSRFIKEGAREWGRRMKLAKSERRSAKWSLDDVQAMLRTEHNVCLVNEGRNYWKTSMWADSLNIAPERLDAASRP
jgi:hypothetical protein